MLRRMSRTITTVSSATVTDNKRIIDVVIDVIDVFFHHVVSVAKIERKNTTCNSLDNFTTVLGQLYNSESQKFNLH